MANAHVVLAAQGSHFGLTDIREDRFHEGIVEAVSGAIGRRRATELALTGRVFSTQEALAFGLIHSVSPAFELEDRAQQTAEILARAGDEVVQSILRGAREKGVS